MPAIWFLAIWLKSAPANPFQPMGWWFREKRCTRMNRSSGEAAPVVKPAMAGPAPRPGAVIDNAHWTVAGSRLLTGRVLVRIVYTGGDTLYGEIARSVPEGRAERTPLQRAVFR